MPDAGWPVLLAVGLSPAVQPARLPAREETSPSHATPWTVLEPLGKLSLENPHTDTLDPYGQCTCTCTCTYVMCVCDGNAMNETGTHRVGTDTPPANCAWLAGAMSETNTCAQLTSKTDWGKRYRQHVAHPGPHVVMSSG